MQHHGIITVHPPVKYPENLTAKHWKSGQKLIFGHDGTKKTGISKQLRMLESTYNVLEYRPNSSQSNNDFREIISKYNSSTIETFNQINVILRTLNNILRERDIRGDYYAHVTATITAVQRFHQSIVEYAFWMVNAHNKLHPDVSLQLPRAEAPISVVVRPHRADREDARR